MSEPLNDTTVDQQNVTGQVVAPAPVADVAVAEVKAGVQDFEKAFQFVADGVAQLGAGAKDELFALAKKYL